MKQKAGLPPFPQPQTKGISLRETETQEDTQMEGFMRHGWDLNKAKLFRVS